MKTFNDVLRRLRRLLPDERLLIDPAHLAAYESDGLTAFAVTPRAVIIAETPEDVIETVRICHAGNVPFVARGSGTSLSGGSLPHADGIVIALNRLDKILELDPAGRVAVVQPGVINLDKIREAVAPGWVCSDKKLRQSLGYAPGAPLEERFSATAAWYREHGWL